MSFSHRFLKTIRSIHLYLGVFTAPALFFFAITGGLQTFSLHEATRGSEYKPPAWLASAAQLHKKQTTTMPTRRARPSEGAAPGTDSRVTPVPGASAPIGAVTDDHPVPAAQSSMEAGPPKPKKNLLPMKLFFALVSLSLFLSTLTGLYMAWRFSRRPKLIGTVFAAGIIVPLLLSLI
ncbi:MAG: PepSY domain-containing protein [Rhodanobacter sp.]